MPAIAIVGDFDDLLDGVRILSLEDQKRLAEDIIQRFYESGWVVVLCEDDCSLIVTKTEKL
jgi:hypothetical protein